MQDKHVAMMRANYDLRAMLMEVDVRTILELNGIKLLPHSNGDEIYGWCPDHHLYTGHFPSHPKWYVNVKTGATHCKTESRGSNIVHVLKRINDCSYEEALNIIFGQCKNLPSRIKMKINERNNIGYENTDVDDGILPVEKNEILKKMVELIKNGRVYERGYNFFKKNDILEKTVDDFNVIEIVSGGYEDRVVIPFYKDDEDIIVGYVAVDLLGKKEWIEKKINRYCSYHGCEKEEVYNELFKIGEETYRKALYCKHASTGSHLFGLDKLVKQNNTKTLIVVEGERDTIKLQQEGFPAVGVHGSSLKFGQKELLQKHGVEELIVVLDGNDAGWRGNVSICERVKNAVQKAYYINLPDGFDPKDYNKKTFDELLSTAQKHNTNTVLFSDLHKNFLMRMKKYETS